MKMDTRGWDRSNHGLALPPFSHTAELLRGWMLASEPPHKIDLLLQRQAAEKLCGSRFDGHTRSSALLAACGRSVILGGLPRDAVSPPARVDLALWAMRREPGAPDATTLRLLDRVLEQAFRQRKIPYRVVGARSFYDRREVKDVVAYLKVINNPHDDMSLLRILNTPKPGIGNAIAELARDRSTEKGNSVWVALCDPDFQRQVPEKSREAVRGFVNDPTQSVWPGLVELGAVATGYVIVLAVVGPLVARFAVDLGRPLLRPSAVAG